jgi:hypothetical protein
MVMIPEDIEYCSLFFEEVFHSLNLCLFFFFTACQLNLFFFLARRELTSFLSLLQFAGKSRLLSNVFFVKCRVGRISRVE